MRKLLVLTAILFCFSFNAAANDSAADSDPIPPSSVPAAPASSGPSDYPIWQLAAGFQYQHYHVFGQSFPNYGFNVNLSRAINSWVSLEGITTMGFGHTVGTQHLVAKSLFVGGGPRLTIRNDTRFEPWMHVLVGLDHIRFTQTSTLGSENALAFLGGIGVDYKFRPRLYLRLEGDYLGTRFPLTVRAYQSNYSVGSSIVFNF